MRDASGQIKPFNRFLSDIQKIDKTYNKTYLQAEYNFAVASSQAAARWQEITEGGDDFLLQYRTAKDERVREQHRILDGITLPPSDKFWDEFFPPNGWNCRCTAVQVNPRRYPESDPEEALQRGRSATYQPNANGQNKAAIFRFNAGKNKIIFSRKHPYFKALEKLPQGIYTEEKIGDGRIFWREQQKDNEFGENERIAKFLARKYGYDIELLPVINENGIKTADSYNYTLGVKQEYKQVTSINSLSMRLRKGAKQAGYVVLNVIEPHSKFEIIKAVKGRFNLTPELRAVHIITSDDDYILYR